MSSRRLTALVLFIASSVFSSSANAQQKSPTDSIVPRFTIGSTQMMLGYAHFGFADLDSRFAAAGLPKVAGNAATFGVGADLRSRRFLFGASIQSLLGRDNSDAAYRTHMSGSFSLFDVGAATVRRHGLTVYPLAGVGATHLSVNVKQRGDFAFDDGLQNPGREIALSGITALGHVGLLVEQRLKRGDSEYAITLRAGIMRSLGSQAWNSADSKVDNGPSGTRGSYLRLTFARPMHSRRDAVLPVVGTLAQTVIR
jgi:hypothetical protein